MKLVKHVTLGAMIGLLITVSVSAQPKARKLTADAYIKTAKIEISNTDTTRYAYATVMLDSLFMYYGPFAEGFYWIARMKVDMNEKNSDLKKKKYYMTTFAAYEDSIHQVCKDPKAKLPNKKGCDKFLGELDSIKVLYWRTYYNNGVEQLKQIGEQVKNLEKETDSTAIAEANKIVTQNTDSCLDNMELAIILDPSDSRPYIGLASAYERQKKFDESNSWLVKGLERAADSAKPPLLQQLAYNNVNRNKYCDAIPYFKQMVSYMAKDTGVLETMYNLSICYNNCKQYDSAVLIYREMLAIDPANKDALTGVGRSFSQSASRTNDSARLYDSLKNDALVQKWRTAQKQSFDSSQFYLRKVFELSPEDGSIAEEYGIVSELRQDYGNAAIAFARASKIDSTKASNWTNLADCYVYLKRFKDAVPAYERVIALEPDNHQVLEQLKLLYHETGNAAKEAEVDKKLGKK